MAHYTRLYNRSKGKGLSRYFCGYKLRSRRLALGLSQAQLANLIGTNQARIARLETAAGRSVPVEIAVELAAALSIPLDALLSVEGEANDKPRIPALSGAKRGRGGD